MMTKFKVGDRVKFVYDGTATATLRKLEKYKEFTITKIGQCKTAARNLNKEFCYCQCPGFVNGECFGYNTKYRLYYNDEWVGMPLEDRIEAEVRRLG